MSDMGRVVRKLRSDAGLTQDALAEALDISRNYVSLVERGERRPSWRFLAGLANVLRVPVQDVLRAAGLVSTPPDTEAEIAALVAQMPDLAGILAFAREHPDRLREVLDYAHWIVRGAPEEARDCAAPGVGPTVAPADS